MVEIAGGNCGIGKTGEPSFRVEWNEILDFSPHICVVMPCGFNIDRTLDEIDLLTNYNEWHQLQASRKGNVYIVDANSYFSRPSPRIVQGIEILAKIIHPNTFKENTPSDSFINLRNYIHLQNFLG